MRHKLLFSFLFFYLWSLSLSANQNKWLGDWIALDEWQSEFEISLDKDGKAVSNYGNGDKGEWRIVDNNVEIIWDSGKKDFLFFGVMGIQRLSENQGKKTTTGLRKKNLLD